MLPNFIKTNNEASTLIIRFMVGLIFLTEGVQKFMFADKLGVGRFIKIGLPHPSFLAPFVGCFEILCGIMVVLGLFTRLAAIPLLIIILVAIATTKMQLLNDGGFWSMLHESRTDWCMLLGSIFLIIKGGGRWSLDRQL